jgi:hypothetical protein
VSGKDCGRNVLLFIAHAILALRDETSTAKQRVESSSNSDHFVIRLIPQYLKHNFIVPSDQCK